MPYSCIVTSCLASLHMTTPLLICFAFNHIELGTTLSLSAERHEQSAVALIKSDFNLAGVGVDVLSTCLLRCTEDVDIPAVNCFVVVSCLICL